MAIDTKVAHIDREVHDAIKAIARHNGMMVGPFMSKILRDHVDKFNKKYPPGKLPL